MQRAASLKCLTDFLAESTIVLSTRNAVMIIQPLYSEGRNKKCAFVQSLSIKVKYQTDYKGPDSDVPLGR